MNLREIVSRGSMASQGRRRRASRRGLQLAVAIVVTIPSAAGSSVSSLDPVLAATPLGFRHLFTDGDLRIMASDATDPDNADDWKQLIGARPALSDSARRRLLQQVADPNFEWATARHALYPTTDITVQSIPWLEEEMDDVLRNSILPGFASLFGVDESHLLMRDMFVVKYASDAQRELASHWDESCFSFVLQVS